MSIYGVQTYEISMDWRWGIPKSMAFTSSLYAFRSNEITMLSHEIVGIKMKLEKDSLHASLNAVTSSDRETCKFSHRDLLQNSLVRWY